MGWDEGEFTFKVIVQVWVKSAESLFQNKNGVNYFPCFLVI